MGAIRVSFVITNMPNAQVQHARRLEIKKKKLIYIQIQKLSSKR